MADEETADEEGSEVPLPPPRPGLRTAAFFLYIPLTGAVGALALMCLMFLSRGQGAGLYVLLYGPIFYTLARRMVRVRQGLLDGTGLWKDIIACALGDVLLAILAVDFVS